MGRCLGLESEVEIIGVGIADGLSVIESFW